MPVATDIAASDRSDINRIYLNNIIIPRENQRIRDAIQIPYRLSDESIKILEKMIYPRIVVLTDAMRDSTHPEASSLNYIANMELVQHARTIDEKFIDIGSDLRLNNADHCCTLVDNHRDASRYLNQATVLSDDVARNINHNLFNRLNSGINTCFKGAEHCGHKAKVAISAHSLYDIPIENIGSIFSNHDLYFLIAMMYLPYELVDIDIAQIKSDFYKFKKENDQAYFAFKNDCSFIYVHNYNNWAKYLTTSLIECKDFDITIEISRSYGPMHKLIFTRVPKYKFRVNMLIRTLPLGDIENYVKVPNMRYVVAHDGKIRFKDIPMIVCRKNVAMNLYKFVCKGPDGVFSYERGANYLHGMSSRIVVGNAVYTEEMDKTPEDYDDLLLSIMSIAAMARLRRTKTYGKAVRMFDNSFQHTTEHTRFMFDSIKEFYEEFKDAFKDFFFGDKKEIRMKFNEPNSKDFMMFTIDFFRDVNVNERVKAKQPHKIVYKAEVCAAVNGEVATLTPSTSTQSISSVDSVSICSTIDTIGDCSINEEIIETKVSRPMPMLVEPSHITIENNNNEMVVTKSKILNEQFANLYNNKEALSRDDQLYAKIIQCESRIIANYKTRAHAKIDDIMNHYFRKKTFDRIYDIACAPGCFAYSLAKYTKKIIGYNYVGVNALKLDQRNKMMYYKITDFEDIDEINIKNADLIVSDIGDEEHTVANLRIMNLYKSLNKGGNLIFKMWLEQVEEIDFENLPFCTVNLYKPPSSLSINSEFYVILQGYNTNLIKHVGWKAQLYIILKRINGYYDMYKQNHDIDNYAPTSPSTTFEEELVHVTYDQAKKYEAEFQINGDEDYEELRNKIKKSIDGLKDQSAIFVKVHKHNAVFGSGKSDYIRSNANARKNDLVVVPTKALKEQFCKDGYKAMTYYSAMISRKTYRNVYFDEFFMHPKCYLYYFAKFNKFDNLYLFGDTKQIGVTDFNGVGYNDKDKWKCNGYQNNVSKRVPQDVCNVVRKYDVECKTTNKQRLSIFTENNINELLKEISGGVKIMTYRQIMKDIYNTNFKNGDTKTIHERQGGNHDIVVWVIEPGDSLISREEYIRVAFTRHYNALVIYGSENIKHSTMNLYNVNIELIAERVGVALFDENYYAIPELHVVKVDDKPFYDKKHVEPADCLRVLTKILDVCGNGVNFNAIRPSMLPAIEQAKVNINPDVFAKMDRGLVGRSLLDFNTCRVYDSKDAFESTNTLMGRYGIKTKLFNNETTMQNIEKMKIGLNKFLKKSLEHQDTKVHFRASLEEMNMYFKDYLEALNKKQLSEGELDHGFDEYLHKNGPRMIKYFMKKQTKFDSNTHWFERAKFGQGVNAWHKLLNAMFSCYARAFSQKFKQWLNHGVFYQNGKPDMEMADEASKCINDFYRTYNKMPKSAGCDQTEFDASQSEVTIGFECFILDLMGLPEEIIDLYKEHRSYWVTMYPGFCLLQGIFKKHSGEPFTLDFNTLTNMSIVGYMLDIKDLCCAQFKGDDSAIFARDVKLSKEGEIFLAQIGMKAKLEISDVCEFTGIVQTQYGGYPDMIRRVAKCFSKIFKDEKDFEEFKLSVYDHINGINNRAQQIQGRYSLMHYYNEILLNRDATNNQLFTVEDFELLEDFMFNFQSLKYDDLVVYKKDTVTISATPSYNEIPTIFI